jgi:hypothetical protein
VTYSLGLTELSTPPWRHVGTGAGLVVSAALGAVSCLAGTVVHREAVFSGGVAIVPYGLALALATTWSVGWAMRQAFGAAGGVCVVVGWLVALAWLLLGRPEGDFVVANDWLGWGLLAGGVIVLGLLVASSVGRTGD